MRRTELFSELLGITLGDGNIGSYPRCNYLRIYCNPRQNQYIEYVGEILRKFFKKRPYRYFRRDAGVVYLEISLKNLEVLLGIKVGSKIRNKSTMPKWIFKKRSHLKACLRGLFDTDGSIYITGGKYKIVNFTSHNPVLLRDIKKSLQLLHFNPYSKPGCVELARKLEIVRFFKEIKPSNLRHHRFD